MLTRLFIDNYRTFEGFTWAPGQVAFVMGRNGSGKSSLFDLLYAVREFVCGDGTVLAVRTLGPGHLLWPRRRTRFVVEAAAGAATTWMLAPGARVAHPCRARRP